MRFYLDCSRSLSMIEKNGPRRDPLAVIKPCQWGKKRSETESRQRFFPRLKSVFPYQRRRKRERESVQRRKADDDLWFGRWKGSRGGGGRGGGRKRVNRLSDGSRSISIREGRIPVKHQQRLHLENDKERPDSVNNRCAKRRHVPCFALFLSVCICMCVRACMCLTQGVSAFQDLGMSLRACVHAKLSKKLLAAIYKHINEHLSSLNLVGTWILLEGMR